MWCLEDQNKLWSHAAEVYYCLYSNFKCLIHKNCNMYKYDTLWTEKSIGKLKWAKIDVAWNETKSMLHGMKQNRCCMEWIKIDVAWNKSKSMLHGMKQNRCLIKWNKIDVAWNETKSMLLGMRQNRCCLEWNKIDVA